MAPAIFHPTFPLSGPSRHPGPRHSSCCISDFRHLAQPCEFKPKMLPYRLFVLVVASICPVFATAITSRALAGSESTSRKGPGGYCTDYIAAYSTNEEAWMKFHHCIWVNPDKSVELFTYIDDVQYWKYLWYRPSKYSWTVNARLAGETVVSDSRTASGTNVKNDIGKIDDSIKHISVQLSTYTAQGLLSVYRRLITVAVTLERPRDRIYRTVNHIIAECHRCEVSHIRR